ncbi:MAG: exonuclease SbcCD subunit D [Pirellulaceae bacterium]
MTTQSLRFLCAGGFQLHAVLGGIAEVPESLLEILTTATYRAAEQAVQSALREEVDFVLLTGDLLDAASGGPRAVSFLRRQFELLHDNGIPVYWSGSRQDLSADWLQHVDMPSNVHLFSDDLVEAKTVVVNDRQAAVILGRSWNPQRPLRAAEFTATSSDVPHLAVVYGACDVGEMPARIEFWAMGGSVSESTSHEGQQVVHLPGWTQGIAPDHVGPHGCTLVHIDAAGAIRLRQVETDAVRWAQERVLVPEGASPGDIRNAMRLRTQKLLADTDRLVLVEWTLAGEGWFNSSLVHEHRRRELLEWLQDEFGKGSQAAWSLSLNVEPPERLRDEWTDEDSILGDYLRIAREFLEEDAKPLVLDIPQTIRHLPDELRTELALAERPVRQRAVREAALLGIGLLRGEERSAEAGGISGRMESEP